MSATSLPTKRLTVYTPELSVIVGGFRPVYLNTFTGESKEGDIIDIPLSTMYAFDLELDFNFDKITLEVESAYAAYIEAIPGSNNYYYNHQISFSNIDGFEIYNSSTYYFEGVFGKTPYPSNQRAIAYFYNRRSPIDNNIRILIPNYTICMDNVFTSNRSFAEVEEWCQMLQHPIAIFQKEVNSTFTNELNTRCCFINNYIGYTGWSSCFEISYDINRKIANLYCSGSQTLKHHLIYNGPDYVGKSYPTKVAKVNVMSVPTYDIVLATDSITSKYIYSDDYCDKQIYNIDPSSNYKSPGNYDLYSNPEAALYSLIPSGPSCALPITAQAVRDNAPIQRFIHPYAIRDIGINLNGDYHINAIQIGIVSVPTTTNYYFAITSATLTFDVNDTVHDISSAIFMSSIATERMVAGSDYVERWVSYVIFDLYDLGDSPYEAYTGGVRDGKLYLHLDREYRMSTYST